MMHPLSLVAIGSCLLGLLVIQSGKCIATEPTASAKSTDSVLVRQINFFAEQRWEREGISVAQPTTDREFVRRVFLDLVGRIPTVQECETFLKDGRPNKRMHLVDVLLSSEDHVQHFADLMDTMLMGRADREQLAKRNQHGWRKYLENAIRENRPWSEVIQEILVARPGDDQSAGSQWYLYERDNDYQQIAEAVAPAVFGVRIECAQCHDHMVADEIKQQHYWGLVAFFNRGKNQNTKNGPRVAESAVGGFSEFANLQGSTSPNLLTFLGASTIPEKRPEEDEEPVDDDSLYDSVSGGEPRVPKFSRRRAFVEMVVSDHPLVARAMVNRLWAIILGRGIVHPYNEMDSAHPPSHPELLGWLAADFATNNYDMRRMIRALVLSRPYQLSSLQPKDGQDPATFAWYQERPLTAEQMVRSTQIALYGKLQTNTKIMESAREQFPDVVTGKFDLTIGDALFFTNNPDWDTFIRNATVQSTDMQELLEKTDGEIVEGLFTRVFNRAPSEDEFKALAEFYSERTQGLSAQDRPPLCDLVWAMTASPEFRFNH